MEGCESDQKLSCMHGPCEEQCRWCFKWDNSLFLPGYGTDPPRNQQHLWCLQALWKASRLICTRRKDSFLFPGSHFPTAAAENNS